MVLFVISPPCSPTEGRAPGPISHLLTKCHKSPTPNPHNAHISFRFLFSCRGADQATLLRADRHHASYLSQAHGGRSVLGLCGWHREREIYFHLSIYIHTFVVPFLNSLPLLFP
jgi:hypothetical protein